MDGLVSIIMPAYNAGKHIAEAVRSVLQQTHRNWELLIVDDGSSDTTASIAASFSDARIRTYHQRNQGVSVARNLGMEHAKGSFVCFLDADDVLPPESLAARLSVFAEHPDASIVDGRVLMMDSTLHKVTRSWTPTFNGEPLIELVRLTGSCFCGNTWMVRWSMDEQARFTPGLTHAEDLLFYITYSEGRRYRFTEEVVLHYRRSAGSSMSDLRGLERSYNQVLAWLDAHPRTVPSEERKVFRRRRRRIMTGSYWHAGLPLLALAAWLRNR